MRESVMVESQLVVATANINRALPRSDAREALEGVLSQEPDLVGLQEWEITRWRLLLETGSVGPVPGLGIRYGGGRYRWNAPLLGGCAVGARADRFVLLRCRPRLLSRPGRAERADRPFGLEPPRVAAVATYRDLERDRDVTLVCYHLASGVQAGGIYRPDRPVLASRHQREVRALERIISVEQTSGREVYAVGDANFHELRLAGLTSAWEGRVDPPATHGRSRRIDDVHGPGRAADVVLLSNASDHKAVVVRHRC
jgi:hypothetical protein